MEAAPPKLHSFRAATQNLFPKTGDVLNWLQGLLVGLFCLFWVHLLFLSWGWNLQLLLCLALGVLFSSILPTAASVHQKKFARVIIASILLLIVGSLPFWWDAYAAWTGSLSGNSHFIGVIKLCGFVLPTSVVCWLMLQLLSFEQTGEINSLARFSFFSGIGCGLLFGTMFAAPYLPVYWLAILTCCSWLILHGSVCFSAWLSPLETIKRPETVSDCISLIFCSAALFFWSMLLPVSLQMSRQFQPETSFFVYGTLAWLVIGFGFGYSSRYKRPLWWPLLLVGFTFACYPLWIRYYLWISSTVSVVSVSMLMRQLVPAILFLSIGTALGRLFRRARITSVSLLLLAGSSLFGIAAGVWSMNLMSLPLLLGVVAAFVLVFCLLSETGNDHRWQLSLFRRQAATASLLTFVCLGAGYFTYAPEQAARYLFATPAFHAWRNGHSLNEIAGLDESRLLKTVESSAGVATYWRYQGSHVQIRQNGIPAGRISQTPQLVPQPTGDVLAVVLPLSLHQAPRNMCLIGLEAGLGLQTALDFPLMSLTCYEDNSTTVDQARQGLLSETLHNCWQDSRLQLKSIAFDNESLVEQQSYDVILEFPPHSAVYRHSSHFQQQHYRQIRQQLHAAGIYCQRLTFTDYGPAILKSLMETMEQEFGYVTAFDTAPGELLLMAASSEEVIYTDGLMQRLSAPQVRRSLARIGWDWSIAMNLARFDAAAVADASGYGLQNIWQGVSCFRLPLEMMRWGDKWGEVRQLLVSQQQRLLEQYAEDEQAEDVLKRLSDVATREQVLTRNTDQFWAYRQSLKKRLLDKPRTVIEPVKGEGLQQKTHPDDQFRLDYFEALGKTASQQPLSPGHFQEVLAYAEPYDPMISYFLHPELARLYQRCQPRQPDQELAHWLHAIYFGSQKERSVRAIHRSLELLADEPVQMTAAEKYDQINTLLELLELRWQARRAQSGIKQQIMLLDLQNSLKAAETGLTALSTHGLEAKIPTAETSRRQQMLEKSLVQMLKNYRVELQARASRSRYPLPGNTTPVN